MILAGCSSGGVTTCTTADKIRVYVNNGNGLVENVFWGQNLSSIGYGSLSLGDIDNDGDLDLVAMGDTGGGNGTVEIYTNNGFSFVENHTWTQDLSNVDAYAGSVVLGDIDNDGDLDLGLVGAYPSSGNGVYINNGTALEKDPSFLDLPYVGYGNGMGSFDLGDIDNDGDLDLIFFGNLGGDFYRKIYINNGTSLVENSTWLGDIIYYGWAWPSLILGDYDNDGDLDLASIGTGGGGGDKFFIFNNTNNTFIYNQRIASAFDGSISWGDYDNDGDLDLAHMGKEEGSNSITNNNATFFQYDNIARSDLKEDDMQQGSLAWMDLDLDLDLDLACSGLKYGNGYLTKIYISNSTTPNNIPTSPSLNFNSIFNFSTGKLTLTWGNGSDAETQTLGLYYNLRVGTCSGCHDVVSGVFGGSSNPTAGYFGNMMQRKSIVLNRPDLENKTIYWAVQTIDTGLAKSEWSTEQVFEITQTCTENWAYGDWGSCVNGQQTRTATDLNNCGTEINKSITTQSCSSPPSGPSGPSEPSGPVTSPDKEKEEPENVTGYFEMIEPGVDTGLSLNKEGLAIRQVWVKVKSEVVNVSVEIKKLETRPSFIAEGPEGHVYQYVNITYANLPDEEIEEGKVMFKVEKEWIEGDSINSSTIRLARFYNGQWKTLKTGFDFEDSETIHYRAETEGFSIFAIAGHLLKEVEMVCVPLETKCSGNELMECSIDGMELILKEACEYGCENSACKERGEFAGGIPPAWYLIIAVLVVVGGLILAFKRSLIPRSSFP